MIDQKIIEEKTCTLTKYFLSISGYLPIRVLSQCALIVCSFPVASFTASQHGQLDKYAIEKYYRVGDQVLFVFHVEGVLEHFGRRHGAP